MTETLVGSLVVLSAASAGSTSVPQKPELITNIDARVTISLNGQWPAIIDPMGRGDKHKYYRNRKPKNKSELIEYDFDTTETLHVPGDWNSQQQHMMFYEGNIWYRKSFDYQVKKNKRVFVYFGAANYEAAVWLNGKELGTHEGGFTPFNFEITDKVRPGNNFLVVKVNNERRAERIPTLDYDWWNYGGLTRRVMLVELPETFIQDCFIQLRKDSQQDISGWVKLNGPKLQQKITIEIPEAGIKKTFTADKHGVAEVNFGADLMLWSPETPKLYEVTISAENDAVKDLIGFRTIETKGADILLNGEPVFLRGVSIHEEAPYRGGRAYSEDDGRTLLGWARELNCNFVRLAHYPHNEHIVRLADQMGFLVWAEVPLWQRIQWENQATLDNAKSQLAELIIRDKNRAAVILWSIANETWVSEARTSFLKELINLARSLDTTRLTTLAMHGFDSKKEDILIDDPLGEQIDVLGCNEYIGWYGPDLPESADSKTWSSIYDKPLIISEFGAGALYGYRGDPLTRWTEDYQENLYNHQISMLRKITFLRGTTPWILMDFRSPRRPLDRIQDFWNRKGLVSNGGQKKRAFYVLQKFYEQLKQSQSKAPSGLYDKRPDSVIKELKQPRSKARRSPDGVIEQAGNP
ncbi:MAG: glycoside hydrolase family 2 protein [Planctomycetota bacterium]|jgi:beta-glucuronidase